MRLDIAGSMPDRHEATGADGADRSGKVRSVVRGPARRCVRGARLSNGEPGARDAVALRQLRLGTASSGSHFPL